MTEKEQHEKNLADLIEMLKTSMNDVGSFRKNEIATYFLMMRKFFKNYVKENNEMYGDDSELRIGNQEAENINYFLNSMIEIFEKSPDDGYMHQLTVLNKENLEKLAHYQFIQMEDIQNGLKRQSEIANAHNHKINQLLKELGIQR